MKVRRSKQFKWSELSTYNSEVARGIVHTPEWKRAMRDQQAQFDREHRAAG